MFAIVLWETFKALGMVINISVGIIAHLYRIFPNANIQPIEKQCHGFWFTAVFRFSLHFNSRNLVPRLASFFYTVSFYLTVFWNSNFTVNPLFFSWLFSFSHTHTHYNSIQMYSNDMTLSVISYRGKLGQDTPHLSCLCVSLSLSIKTV